MVALPALGFLAASLAAGAQQVGKVYRIGILRDAPASTAPAEAIVEALRPLGYVEGQNLVVERRYTEGKSERLPALATDLVQANVDLILTIGTPATLAAKHATLTIPIVFNLADDPVATGLVASFSRPGGNVTGFRWGTYDEKRLQLLREAVPHVSRVAVLHGRSATDLSKYTRS